MMNKDTASGHLERSMENDRLRRALAARLDRAFKRAGLVPYERLQKVVLYAWACGHVLRSKR